LIENKSWNQFSDHLKSFKYGWESCWVKKNILDNDRKKISNFLAYIDRRYDLRLLCKKINIGYDEGKKIAKVLERKNIIKEFI
jgi:nuclear transport factor 2 (NTF2) superfamily protein